MLHAAEKKDAKRVDTLNYQKFTPEYKRVMPKQYEQGSLANLYDTARNKLINSINDVYSCLKKELKSLLKQEGLLQGFQNPSLNSRQ